MRALEEAVQEVVAVDAAALPDAALADDLIRLRRQINRLEAAWQSRLEHFDRRGLAEQHEQIGTASWLTRHVLLDPMDARARIRLAKRLAEMPLAAAGFDQGALSVSHARVIGTAVADVGAQNKAFAEKVLTETAPHVEPIALDRVSQRLRYELDTDTADERAKKQYESRGVTAARTFGGATRLVGNWDATDGDIVMTALQAASKPFVGDTRTAKQRRADAMVDICSRYLASGELPKSGGVRPQVLLRVDLGSVLGQPGAKAAELTWAGPITGENARRLLCDASITRVITDGASQVLDVGRAVRSFTPAMRAALLTQWETCFWEGCTQPAVWSEGHHIEHWLDDGETSTENGCLPCTHHHHVIHDQGWQLEKLPDGTIICRLGDKVMVCKPNAP